MAIIAISRGTLSGGEGLARLVGEALDHPVLGREVLVMAAEKAGITEAELFQKMERPPGWWDRVTANRRRYVIAVQAALVEHAVEGRLVYHGFAGHLLLEGVPKVLRVRAIAPLPKRIHAAMRTQHIDRAEAERYVRHVDDERARWTKFVHGVDWTDPSLYDLVLNLDRVTVESAAEAIVRLARQPELALDEQARKTLMDLKVACHVRLALALSPATRDLDCYVRADDGRVVVTLQPRVALLSNVSDRLDAEIRRAVENVPDVRHVRFDVQSFPPER